MLHDFSFRAPDELLAGLTGTTAEAAERMATQTEDVPSPRAKAGAASATPAPPACRTERAGDGHARRDGAGPQ